MTRIQWGLVLVAVASCLVPGLAASADDVVLTNGRVFEDVVAWVEGDRVAVRLPHGLIRLPQSKVVRIVPGETSLATYLERKQRLGARTADAEALAAEWVELAVWARDEGLASSYREAARTAADLDPRAPGLESLMRDLDLHFDDRADRWVTEDELMRARGLVRYDGAWVTPGERAEAVARIAEAQARAAEARREREQNRVLVELASALRAEAEAEAMRESRRPVHGGGIPVVYWAPGYWVPPAVTPGQGTPGQAAPGGDHDGGAAPAPRPSPHAGPRAGGSNRGTFRASDWIPGKLNPRAAPPPGTLTGSTARTGGN